MTLTVPLKRLIDPLRPITYGIVQAGEDVEGGVPYIRPVDMDGHRGVNPKGLRTTSPEIAAAYARSAVQPGDVVVSIGPSFGKTMVVPQELDGANLTQGTARVALRSDVSARFVVWSLQSQYAHDYWETSIGGATFRALNLGPLANTPIRMPSSIEQVAIADYLDRETGRVDTLIEEQQRLIEMLRERRVAVVLDALTGDRGNWQVDKLGRHTRIGNGSTPRRDNQSYWADEGFPWLNSAVVNLDFIDSADQFVTERALAECHLPVVRSGSVLVGLTGQGKTRGMATLLASTATVNQHLAYVTPESDSWDSRFLLWALRAAYEDLRALSDENGSTKGGLTCADLKSFRIARPSVDEQRRIAARLDDQTVKIDQLMVETERFIELSRERRAALITAAVTGQIDVREVA